MPEIPPLYSHQERVVQAALAQPRLWINAVYGCGKTVMALEIIKRKKAKALVIAPLTLIETSWRGDWERFGYDQHFRFVKLKLDKKTYSCSSQGLVSVLHYTEMQIVNPESFIRLSPEQVNALGCDTLIIDEASKLKNRSSKISKAVYEMSRRVKSVYLLSGNLAPNGEHELFSPIRCLDETVLGSSYYGFMGRYFDSSVGYAPGGRTFKKWKMRESKRQELADKLKRVSIRVGKEDAPELPPQTFVVREIELEPEQRRVYETLKKDWIVKHQGVDVVAANALAELSKLRQIASGFIYSTGQCLGVGKSKLSALKETLEEIGENQVVVFSCWQEEIRQIKALLGDKAGCVYGEVKDGDKAEAIKGFQSGDLRYLICHPRSGGVGLNLQSAHYAVYASLDYSLESWEQSVARISRSGQSHPCVYTVLLAKDTIDEAIYKALLKKASVADALSALLREAEAA